MLIHGDCLEEMKKIPDKSIDLVLTDPPYGTTACKWDSVIPFEPMWAELKRVRKDNAAICLFGSEPFSSALRMSNIKEFKYDWVWQKHRPIGMLNAKHQPMRNHEIISLFYAKKINYFPIKEKRKTEIKEGFKAKVYSKNCEVFGKHNDTEFKKIDKLRYPATVQSFSNIISKNERFAPTQKPIALLEYLIKTYTLEGETVLDFTMGSGSTGVACKNLGRKFIGIEKDEKYFEIAKQRITTA
jgi:site-specific DNA-methyltransferase (adenine-specific)